ncbi:MAG TPA: winged helix-turn-helix transcriptional regulator [Nitrospirae bacterium]|nr:hypothetical protein BMS3Abin06_01176 [bacterium BMS3Abin06]HDH13600.1 winged helix-turn-helix transcriptional regulator [Nitrospirota bacterium]HDZ01180.1 winged helix-turn-helix transcriptional regulator [Nitrospirota bacterium]
MNVQNLNKKDPGNPDSYKSLLMLDEISKGEPLSQRDLSKKLNIALGLVNSYIKNLVLKGYITIKAIPSKRYAYYLTSQGFAEKTRLTYHHLQNYTNLYKNARRDFQQLFNKLYINGIRKVVFAGIDEATEIAFLSLQEVDIKFEGVVDDNKEGKSFFKTVVMPFAEINKIDCDGIILTAFIKRDNVYEKLLENGVPREKIHTIYQIAKDEQKSD